MKRRSRLLEALSAANLAAVAALWFLGSLVAERWWPATVITYLPQLQFGAPLVVLLALSVWKRRARALGINIACAALFLLGPMGYRLHLPRTKPSGTTVRVMTYNIRGGTWDLPGVIRTIRDARPDVVCLQEATARTGVASARLERTIREGLPDYRACRSQSVMTLTRLQVTSMDAEQLIVGSHSRPLVRMGVRVGGRRLTVANVHFVLSRDVGQIGSIGLRSFVEQAVDVRRTQAEALIAATARTDRALVVCGDFNTPPRGVVYDLLRERWSDAAAESAQGFGYTFTSKLPVLRIDYVWLSRDLSVSSVSVPGSQASDHRPVVAEIVLR